jgi:trehalose 6-phosphate phosphatase
LAERVARAARRAGAARTLLLDLDGTLAPIAPTPADAEVPAATLAAMENLVKLGWSVAVISGRPAADAAGMIPVAGVKIFGSHGAERRRRPSTKAAARRLERLAAQAEELAAGVPGAMVERKPFGIALHDRQVARGRLASWRRMLEEWLAVADTAGLERLDGKRVVELRPRGANKGTVVEQLSGGCAVIRPDDSLVAIGDDETDEDMFRTMKGKGLAVRIAPPGAKTLAGARLASPLGVQRFLLRLAELSEE